MDEWNIWYQNDVQLQDWAPAPAILEDHYSFLDSLAFAGLTISLLNHCDRVKIACLAQLVNVIAPIMTQSGGAVLKQTTYYPFYFFARYGRGTVLQTSYQGPYIATRYGDTAAVIAACVHDHEQNAINVFIVNTDLNNEHSLNLQLASFGDTEYCEHFMLHSTDLHAVNTFDEPEQVAPIRHTDGLDTLPAGSFALVRYRIVN